MIRIYAGGLPPDMTEQELSELFSEHGRVRELSLAHDVFTGRCRGFGFVAMEGHHARAAITGLNGREVRGHILRVKQEKTKPGARRGGRR